MNGQETMIAATVFACTFALLNFVIELIKNMVGTKTNGNGNGKAGVQAIECKYQHEAISREQQEIRQTLKDVSHTLRDIADGQRDEVQVMVKHHEEVITELRKK